MICVCEVTRHQQLEDTVRELNLKLAAEREHAEQINDAHAQACQEWELERERLRHEGETGKVQVEQLLEERRASSEQEVEKANKRQKVHEQEIGAVHIQMQQREQEWEQERQKFNHELETASRQAEYFRERDAADAGECTSLKKEMGSESEKARIHQEVLEKEIAADRSQMERREQEWEQERQKLNHELETVTRQVGQLREECAAGADERSSLETKVEDAYKRQNAHEQEIGACHTQMDQREQEWEQERQKLNHDMETVTRQVEQLREECAAGAEERASLETKVEDAYDRQNVYELEIGACHTQMEQREQEWEEERQKLSDEVETVTRQVEQLQEQRAADAAERAALEDEVENAKERHTQMEQREEKWERERQKLIHEVETFARQAEHLREQRSAAAAERSLLETEVAAEREDADRRREVYEEKTAAYRTQMELRDQEWDRGRQKLIHEVETVTREAEDLREQRTADAAERSLLETAVVTEREEAKRRQEVDEQERAAYRTQMEQRDQEWDRDRQKLIHEVETVTREAEHLREQRTVDADERSSLKAEVVAECEDAERRQEVYEQKTAAYRTQMELRQQEWEHERDELNHEVEAVTQTFGHPKTEDKFLALRAVLTFCWDTN